MPGVTDFEQLLEVWDGETAVIHRDRETGGWMFVCVHSTRLGPSGGGTRLRSYLESHLRDLDSRGSAEPAPTNRATAHAPA